MKLELLKKGFLKALAECLSKTQVFSRNIFQKNAYNRANYTLFALPYGLLINAILLYYSIRQYSCCYSP